MTSTSRSDTRRAVRAWCLAVAYPLAVLTVMAGELGGLTIVLVVLAQLLAIALLRRQPLPALLLMLVGFALTEPAFHGWYSLDVRIVQVVAIDVAIGYIAATRPRRTSIAAAAFALVAQLLMAGGFPLGSFNNAVIGQTLGVITVWVVGNSVRQRRDYAQAQRLQAEHEAVQAERLRIARELHDMIAHSIGVIAIQAGVGRRVIDTQPDEARNALNAIEDTSRETLAGLRRMLGSLREADASLAPAPGLADLDSLTARTLDAGVRVDVEWRGERQPLPPDIDLSAFRIVQEAVTNVVRHAATDRCTVVLEQHDGELSIEVSDGGRGGAVGAGYGIAGMRERVSLLHGEFSAGPRPEGGFRVAARVPVPAGVR